MSGRRFSEIPQQNPGPGPSRQSYADVLRSHTPKPEDAIYDRIIETERKVETAEQHTDVVRQLPEIARQVPPNAKGENVTHTKDRAGQLADALHRSLNDMVIQAQRQQKQAESANRKAHRVADRYERQQAEDSLKKAMKEASRGNQ